jgi:hypothetical protein
MTVEVFLMLLTLFSTVTSLFTEALKKAFDAAGAVYATNMLVLISAIVVGGGGTFAYYMLNGVELNIQNAICILVMVIADWIGATVGYDKVMQLITQIKK